MPSTTIVLPLSLLGCLCHTPLSHTPHSALAKKSSALSKICCRLPQYCSLSLFRVSSITHTPLSHTPNSTPGKKKERAIKNVMPSTTILPTLSLSGFLYHTHPTLTYTPLHTINQKERANDTACYERAHSVSFGFSFSHTPHSHIHPTPHL